MGDKLQDMYNAWKTNAGNPDGTPLTEFQAFQGGVTAGAVSMRERAMAVADSNEVKDAIGQLPDIPQ